MTGRAVCYLPKYVIVGVQNERKETITKTAFRKVSRYKYSPPPSNMYADLSWKYRGNHVK